LREAGLEVVDVSVQTGFPEVMDGRVKTLHPNIHMALLARNGSQEDFAVLKKYNLEPFDLVVGNLYPFEEEPSVETIDIGGPSFLRAAAKNFERITVVCNPEDYPMILEKPDWTITDRQQMAAKVFSHTAAYDSMIAAHYAAESRLQFNDLGIGTQFIQPLRYGENPQQKAAWFRVRGSNFGLHQAVRLQGKELSYNNILDLDSAVSTVREFKNVSACVAVKHNSPCGVAISKTPLQALKKCVTADPQSVFGGIIAANFLITSEMVEVLNHYFLECVIAPKFDSAAKELFAKKKNLRLLEWPEILKSENSLLYRSVAGGMLVQTADQVCNEWSTEWTFEGAAPTPGQKEDLLTAWQVCAHLKSNAIAVVANGQTVGLGMGQVNRVDAVDQALMRYKKFHSSAKDVVLASDAFFPFADSIEKIAAAGVKCIIQPGGSVKDEEVKECARKLGVTMVLTGQRHFLH
jgi:phosphoribosylaminoimidazolecarboxamide formyltransferase / IMP cyclohydrolase